MPAHHPGSSSRLPRGERLPLSPRSHAGLADSRIALILGRRRASRGALPGRAITGLDDPLIGGLSDRGLRHPPQLDGHPSRSGLPRFSANLKSSRTLDLDENRERIRRVRDLI